MYSFGKIVVVFVVVAILALGISATACQTEDPTHTGGSTDAVKVFSIGSDGVYFYHDEVRGVGIWVYDAYKRGGVAVLPDSEYKSEVE